MDDDDKEDDEECSGGVGCCDELSPGELFLCFCFVDLCDNVCVFCWPRGELNFYVETFGFDGRRREKNFPNLMRGSRCAFVLVPHTRHTSCQRVSVSSRTVCPFTWARHFPLTISPSAKCVCVCVRRIFPVYFRQNRSWLSPDFPYIFDVTFWALLLFVLISSFVLVVQISSPFRQPDCLVAFRVPRTCVHEWPPCWPRGKTSSIISKVFWFASVTFCEVVQKSPNSETFAARYNGQG